MKKRASLLQEGLKARVCTYTLTSTIIHHSHSYAHTHRHSLSYTQRWGGLALKQARTAGCRLPGKAWCVPPSRLKHKLPSQRLFVGADSSPAPWLSAGPCTGACSRVHRATVQRKEKAMTRKGSIHEERIPRPHRAPSIPPLSLSFSSLLSLSHTFAPTSLSLSLSPPSYSASSHTPLLGCLYKIIDSSVCVCVQACVLLCWFPVTVRRGDLPYTSSPGIPFISLPALHRLPSISFTRYVGDMRTWGCCLHPVCCCSVECIIHGMTGSEMADGGRGGCICVKRGGAFSIEGTILILAMFYETTMTQKTLRD